MLTSFKVPKRLSVEEKASLIKRVEAGESVVKVCRQAGISRTVFYQWRKKYQEAAPRAKKKTLVSKISRGKRHWKKLPAKIERKILKTALENPALSPQKISVMVGISAHGIWNILKENALNTQSAREAYVHRYGSSLIKPPTVDDKLAMIRRFEAGDKVAHICKGFGLSRTTFYKWLKRYEQASGERRKASLTSWRPKEEKHWRFVPRAKELILKIVIEYPNLSSQKISQRLPLKEGKPILGSHGVYNVLKRLGLNTYEKRLVYVQTQTPVVTPAFGLPAGIKRLFGKIPAISAIPPPIIREKVVSLIRPFAFSFLSSIVFSTIFIYWFQSMVQAPSLGAKFGFFFATVALVTGGFFFTYSMKYYFTLGLVLSFSRRASEEGGNYELKLSADFKNSNGSPTGWQGWLKKTFGLNGNGNGNGNSNSNGYQSLPSFAEQTKDNGLQPNLDHIKPERFPFFSIQLPFYNEKRVAKRIIQACMSMDYPKNKEGRPNYEVIVCDDSTDETVDIVLNYQKSLGKVSKYIGKSGEEVLVVKPKNKPILKVLHRQTRSGFKGAALGYALQNIDPRTEFINIFDADFIPYPDTLSQFLKYFKAAGGWDEKKDFRTEGIVTMPYDTNEKVNISRKLQGLLAKQVAKIRSKSQTAVVAGYQWHVLNKSENWITRGVRTEYAGSYVVERPGQEILGAMKIIHGSVYCIRADVLKHFGWGISITEDYELTLRVYEHGFKVVFTPYVQAPSECVSTIKRLIRQRMRWAEGHSYNTRKQFAKLMFNPKLNFSEKLEFAYLTPYYLQAAFFIIGTFSWLISEAVFQVRLPFWTEIWGWSLVLTNLFALPLVNSVGLFLEESEKKDYLGILSFIALCYIVVPFQAYAAVKGFLEPKEGTWFRTPKSGRITDVFARGKFYRWVLGILPGKPSISSQVQPAYLNQYLALATANNRFANFKIVRRRVRRRARGLTAVFLIFLLVISSTLVYLAPGIPRYQPEPFATGIFATGSKGNFKLPIVKAAEDKNIIRILDVHSHPQAGENWEVAFETTGTADLIITPEDKATVDDLEFISLVCGERQRTARVLEGDVISYPDWECLEKGKVTYLVNVSGKHTLKFQFGDKIAYAYNQQFAEIISKRTINSKTYRNEDGTSTANFWGLPVHYQDDKNQWQDIDTTIVSSTDPDYDFMNITNNTKTYFAADAYGTRGNVKLQKDDASIVLGTVTGLKVNDKDKDGKEFIVEDKTKDDLKPKDDEKKDEKKGIKIIGDDGKENMLKYNKIFENDNKKIDVVYTALDFKLQEEIILNEYQGFPEISQKIELANAYAKVEGKDIVIYHKDTNEFLWILPEPRMYEQANQLNTSTGLYYELTCNDNQPIEQCTNLTLTKVLDKEGKDWLVDVVYPVVIDPDFSAQTADGQIRGLNATYATARSTSDSFNATNNYFFLGQRRYSSNYYVFRGFLKFDTASLPDGSKINQVNLKLVCQADFSVTADFDVQIVKQDWSAQDPLSDANRETAYDDALSGTADGNIWRNTNGIVEGTQYTSGNLSTSWPSKTGSTYYSLRSSLDKSGTAPAAGNERIAISTAEHPTAGNRPVLAIDYNVPPNTPSLDLPSDTATGVSLTPDLKTTATDDDSDSLRYKIQLDTVNTFDSGDLQTFDQTVSQTGWSATEYASGVQATYTVQSDLNQGEVYYWRSYAIDYETPGSSGSTNTWSGTQSPPYSFTTIPEWTLAFIFLAFYVPKKFKDKKKKK